MIYIKKREKNLLQLLSKTSRNKKGQKENLKDYTKTSSHSKSISKSSCIILAKQRNLKAR